MSLRGSTASSDAVAAQQTTERRRQFELGADGPRLRSSARARYLGCMAHTHDHPRTLRLARLVAWSVTLAGLLLVTMRYGALPERLPLTRWTTAPKSWLIALRVPGIHLLSVALIEVLSPGVRRLAGFTRGQLFTAILLLTASFKAVMTNSALALLPAEYPALTVPTLVVAEAGVLAALFVGRDLLRGGQLRRLAWTKTESALALSLGVLLLALELPIFAARR